MKTYIAIGHFKDSKNITCVVSTNSSDKNFRRDLIGNGFVAFVTFSEKRFKAFKGMDTLEIFDEVKKLTSNYRRWDDVTDYICECFDIIKDRVTRAE